MRTLIFLNFHTLKILSIIVIGFVLNTSCKTKPNVTTGGTLTPIYDQKTSPNIEDGQINKKNIDLSLEEEVKPAIINNTYDSDTQSKDRLNITQKTYYNSNVQPVRKLAVLLPLSGKFASVTSRIKRGIESAKWAHGSKIIVNYFDTANVTDIKNIYNRVKVENHDWILGPIQKNLIEQIQEFGDPNIVALNRVDNQNQILYFDLRTELDSNIAIIKDLLKNNTKYILIIAEEQDSYQHALKMLNKLIKNNDINIRYFNLNYAYLDKKTSNNIKSFLGVNASEQRNKNIKKIAEKYFNNVNTKPYIRDDMQSAYLLTSQKSAKLLTPLLRFYDFKLKIYSYDDLVNERNPYHHDFSSLYAPLQKFKFKSGYDSIRNFGWDSYIIMDNIIKVLTNQYVKGLKSTDKIRRYKFNLYRELPVTNMKKLYE